MGRLMYRSTIAILLTLMSAANSLADQSNLSESVAFFGGIFAQSSFPGDANIPLGGELESNYNFGAIYHRDILELGSGVFLGGEIGGTIRAGDGEPVSGELFTGAAIRYKGIGIGPLVVAPKMTVGFSLVTHTIGVETQRADAVGSDGTLLVYLGPELSFSLKQAPKTEVFYRSHHRSGLLKTFENMSAGHNAHVFGIRKKF